MTKSTRPILLTAILALVPAYRGNSEPWARHAIDPADAANGVMGADGVKLADINGDGRLNIVTGWEEGNRIRFYLQPELSAIRDPWPHVEVAKINSPEDAVFADLDGDGRLDIVSASEGSDRALYVQRSPPKQIPWLLPLLGEVTEGQSGGDEENRQGAVPTNAASDQGMGDGTPSPVHEVSAAQAQREAAWS